MVRPGGAADNDRRSSGRAGEDAVMTARFKGVRMRKWGRWVAEIRQPNSRERIWLGSYSTSEEAARAYDAAAFCLRGASAFLNFPNSPPEIPAPSGDQNLLSSTQIQVAASQHARKSTQTLCG